MKRRLLNNWAILFFILTVINLFLYKYGITPPENPEDYCDTQTLSSVKSCIADLPGEFGTGAVHIFSLFIILIYPVIHLLWITIKYLIKRWFKRFSSI
jgi:hypothetical protein